MALASLSIDLIAKLGNFQSSMEKAGRIAEKEAASMRKSFDSVRAAVSGIGGAIVASVSVGAVTRFIASSIDSADAAIKQARAVGVLTEEITALNFAADLSGVSQDELSSGLQRLARNAKDAGDGVKGSVEAFGQLGISVKGADGQLKGTSQLLAEVADRFAALPDGIKKTATAQELFGRSGANLITLLNGGSAGLREFTEQAERAGVVISTETAVAAEKFNDDLTRMRKNLDGLGLQIATELLPVLNDLLPKLTELAGGPKSDFTASTEIRQLRINLDELKALRGEGFTVFGFFGDEAAREAEISRIEGELKDALQRFYRVTDVQGGRGRINPPFALLTASPDGKPARPGPKAAIPNALTDPINEQLVFFLRSEKDAYAEIDAYLKGAAERAEELGSAITDPINQIKVDFLASEKAAYDLTDADVTALLSNIEKLDARTEQFLANVQDAFGDTLLATFKGSTDQILENWGNLLLQMVSEAAAADLVGALTGQGSTNNLATLGGNFANIIEGLFGGGRAIGGPARRGQLVEVNELGGPGELFTAGGRQYLLPSADGVVTPTAQRPGSYGISAPGASVQNHISIHAPPGHTAETSESNNASGGIDTIVRIVDKRMAAGVRSGASATDRAFRETYGMSRGAGAPRRG